MQGTGDLITAVKNAVVTLGQVAQTLSKVAITQPVPTTVAGLPAAAGNAGKTYVVTDATAPTYGAILVGGGAVYAIALSDNVNWRAH